MTATVGKTVSPVYRAVDSGGVHSEQTCQRLVNRNAPAYVSVLARVPILHALAPLVLKHIGVLQVDRKTSDAVSLRAASENELVAVAKLLHAPALV